MVKTFLQLKLEDRILELQQLNTTDLQKENEAKDAEISELRENTFVSLLVFLQLLFRESSAAENIIIANISNNNFSAKLKSFKLS